MAADATPAELALGRLGSLSTHADTVAMLTRAVTRRGILSCMKIEQVLVDASMMKTVGPGDPAWKDPLQMGEVDGCFVRLDPPLNCPDEDVVRMKAQAIDCGAVAVKVLPVRRDAVLKGGEHAANVEEVPHLYARDVIAGMLNESRSKHLHLLEALIAETMKDAGL